MSGIQKVIKIFAICLAVVIIINIVGWIVFGLSCIVGIGELTSTERSEVIEENRQTYIYTEDVYRNINKIDVDISYAELNIKTGNEFLTIQTDKENSRIKVDVQNNTLKIKENNDWFWRSNQRVVIDVIIPNDMNMKDLNLVTGAGKISVVGINAEKIDVDHGAGRLEILNSKFNKTKIGGGAGTVNISSSVLNDLRLEAGVRQSRY